MVRGSSRCYSLSLESLQPFSRPRHVISRPSFHRPDLANEIVERLLTGVEIEVRSFDDQERRRAVVKEEVLVRLVQLPDVLRSGIVRLALALPLALSHSLQEHFGRRLEVDD